MGSRPNGSWSIPASSTVELIMLNAMKHASPSTMNTAPIRTITMTSSGI